MHGRSVLKRGNYNLLKFSVHIIYKGNVPYLFLMQSSLAVLGIPFSDVMRIFSAILLLGNIEFIEGSGLELDIIGNNGKCKYKILKYFEEQIISWYHLTIMPFYSELQWKCYWYDKIIICCKLYALAYFVEIKAVAALLGVSGVALYRGFTTRTRNTRGQLCKSLADANTVCMPMCSKTLKCIISLDIHVLELSILFFILKKNQILKISSQISSLRKSLKYSTAEYVYLLIF